MKHEDLTTPPDVNRIGEEQIREHFGSLISESATIERIPYSLVWALSDGTLLWDPQNGYANLGPTVKSIIYLAGPAGSGKTTLARMMRECTELNRREYISLTDLSRAIEAAQTETVIVSDQKAFDPDYKNLIESYARNRKLIFYSITLTRNHNGN